jgi:thiamine-phosphate pyrophosphorylase
MFEISYGIYVILDTEVISKANLDIFRLTEKLTSYGVDVFQLRAKNICDKELLSIATKLAKIIHKRKRIFIVNDRADIAYLSGAHGLHLGKDDISPKEARKLLGRNKIIGKTTHSQKELNVFKREPLDYLSFGPVFKTKTKPALGALKKRELKNMLKNVNKPVFVIGGISLGNINRLGSLGIKNIAVCRDIILSKNYKNTIEEFKKCLKKLS